MCQLQGLAIKKTAARPPTKTMQYFWGHLEPVHTSKGIRQKSLIVCTDPYSQKERAPRDTDQEPNYVRVEKIKKQREGCSSTRSITSKLIAGIHHLRPGGQAHVDELSRAPLSSLQRMLRTSTVNSIFFIFFIRIQTWVWWVSSLSTFLPGHGPLGGHTHVYINQNFSRPYTQCKYVISNSVFVVCHFFSG